MAISGTPLIRHYKGTTNAGGSVTLCHGSHFLFDATAIVSTTTTNHFCDLGYKVVFDGVSGNWTNVVKPQSEGVGGIWAWPMRYAGSEGSGDEDHTLTLYVFEIDGSYQIYTWTVTCEDPATTWPTTDTIVFSNDTDFTGAPSGATEVASTSDFDAAIGTYAAPGKRLLFKGGDSFTISTNPGFDAVDTQADPCLIGSFGTGSADVVNGGNIDVIVSGATQIKSLLVQNLDVDMADGSGAWCDIDQATFWCSFQNVHVSNISFTDTVLNSGTAQTGSSNTITLDAGASASDDAYNDRIVKITGGTGSGQERSIFDYVGSTKVATVSPVWTVTPDNTSTYEVVNRIHSKGFLFGGINVRADNEGIGMFQCSIGGDANNFYIEPAGKYFAVIDCTTTFGGTGGSGPTRFPISQNSVVACNRFAASESASNPLRFHSHDHVTSADDSFFVVVAFNYLTHVDASSECRWMILIGPDGNDEPPRFQHHFYLFGNHYVPIAEGVAGQTCVGILQLQDSVSINDIFDLRDARTGNAQCFDFQPYGGSAFSPHNDIERIRISNPIIYDGDSGDSRSFRLLLFGPSVTYTGGTTDGVTIRNALIHKVSSGTVSMIVDTTTDPNPSNITADIGDQDDASATAAASVFANAITGTMSDARDFRHQGTYDPSGALTTDHVRFDWDLKNRQQEVDGLDFGAFEEVDGGLPDAPDPPAPSTARVLLRIS